MSTNWLIPVDGSDTSLRAVKWALDQQATLKAAPQLHLLNVQPKLSADIGRFIAHQQIESFQAEQGNAALAAAKAQCDAAGVPVHLHVAVGESAGVVAQFVKQVGATQVVVGTVGETGLLGTLMGSFAQKVVHAVSVPVTLIK